MSESKHTPGPWVAKEWDECQTAIHPDKTGDGRQPLIAIISVGPGRPDGEANSRLIAAAPDMLAALRELVRVGDRKTVEWDRARAAIAKAEGKS